jgi:hypothetical protein
MPIYIICPSVQVKDYTNASFSKPAYQPTLYHAEQGGLSYIFTYSSQPTIISGQEKRPIVAR